MCPIFNCVVSPIVKNFTPNEGPYCKVSKYFYNALNFIEWMVWIGHKMLIKGSQQFYSVLKSGLMNLNNQIRILIHFSKFITIQISSGNYFILLWLKWVTLKKTERLCSKKTIADAARPVNNHNFARDKHCLSGTVNLWKSMLLNIPLIIIFPIIFSNHIFGLTEPLWNIKVFPEN